MTEPERTLLLIMILATTVLLVYVVTKLIQMHLRIQRRTRATDECVCDLYDICPHCIEAEEK